MVLTDKSMKQIGSPVTSNKHQSGVNQEESAMLELFSNNPESLIGKILHLRKNIINNQEPDEAIWQELLSEWPDKRLLFKLKDNHFDLRRTFEEIQVEENKPLFNSLNTETFNLQDYIEHIGFIWQFEDANDPKNSIQLEPLDEKKALDLSDLKHITFVYELWDKPEQVPTPEIYNDNSSASISPEVIISQVPNEPNYKIPEDDFVSWLKMLDSKVKGSIILDHAAESQNTEPSEQLANEAEMETVLDKATKKKIDAERKSKTAKKLIKKSKKALNKKKNKKEKSSSGEKKSKKTDKQELKEYIFSSLEESDDLATETYAALLAKQGHKEKAIKMYEKLILLNPEKSSFFADKILQLKNKE
jgi:hypothetical protein